MVKGNRSISAYELRKMREQNEEATALARAAIERLEAQKEQYLKELEIELLNMRNDKIITDSGYHTNEKVITT